MDDQELPTRRRLVVPVVLAVTIIGTIAVAASCADHRVATTDAALKIADDASVDDSPIDPAPIDAQTDAPVDTPVA